MHRVPGSEHSARLAVLFGFLILQQSCEKRLREGNESLRGRLLRQAPVPAQGHSAAEIRIVAAAVTPPYRVVHKADVHYAAGAPPCETIITTVLASASSETMFGRRPCRAKKQVQVAADAAALWRGDNRQIPQVIQRQHILFQQRTVRRQEDAPGIEIHRPTLEFGALARLKRRHQRGEVRLARTQRLKDLAAHTVPGGERAARERFLIRKCHFRQIAGRVYEKNIVFLRADEQVIHIIVQRIHKRKDRLTLFT